MHYYYDSKGNYVGCGNEPTAPDGCEARTTPPVQPVHNTRIDEIRAELVALDTRRIRPLAEGDSEYLEKLNYSVSELRSELILLMESSTY